MVPFTHCSSGKCSLASFSEVNSSPNARPPRYKRLCVSLTDSPFDPGSVETLPQRVYQTTAPMIGAPRGSPFRSEAPLSFSGDILFGEDLQRQQLSPSSSQHPSLAPYTPPSCSSDDWGSGLLNRPSTPEASFSTPPGTPRLQSQVIQAPTISKKRKNRLPLEERDPYIQNTIAIKRRLSGLRTGDFPFTIQLRKNREIEIERNEGFLGSGCYQDAYLVTGRGLDHPEFVLKVPKQELLESVDFEIMRGLVAKDIKHYPRIVEAFEGQDGFRVARQYDMEILAESPARVNLSDSVRMVHGCRLVEYVPEAIPEDPLPELLQNRLKEFFAFCWKNKHLHLDVQKSNLHIEVKRIDGEIVDYQIVLIDPVHPQDSFKYVIEQTLTSFAPEGSKLYNFLDPRV